MEVITRARDHFFGFWPLYLSLLTLLCPPCDARRAMLLPKDNPYPKNPQIKHLQVLEVAKNLNILMDVSMKDSSDSQPYVSSPLTLPPYDSLSPTPLPDNSPPFCVFPPPAMPSPIEYSPTPPSSSSPIEPTLGPPSGPLESSPPPFSTVPSPPEETFPGPPTSIPSPYSSVPYPPYYEPSPPSGGGGLIPSPPIGGGGLTPSPPSGGGLSPSPPEYVPSPVGFSPAPLVFQPPVVFPPPIGMSPPTTGAGGGQRAWCVAKPSVPDPILEEGMEYACGSGADCGPIQPNGPCYQPNSLLAHASYAFNSYWQRTKVAGGSCDFGGIAILVTVDPSSQSCRFTST